MERTAARCAEWPIEAYTLIGDSHGAALVAPDGSLDWCCLGRLDAAPAFWRLLDPDAGPFLQIAPAVQCHSEQSYVPSTNVLRTTYAADATGEAELIDFMPLKVADTPEGVEAPGWMIRRLRGLRGSVPMGCLLRRGAKPWRPEAADEGHYLVLWRQGSDFVEIDGESFQFTVRAGETVDFVILPRGATPPSPDAVESWYQTTEAYWTSWAHSCSYNGQYREAVVRSALTLKLLNYAPSGGIAAAATTSLPAIVGGTRNWDYRFTWLRDATMTLHALAVLGYEHEAQRFCEFIGDCCVRSLPQLRVLYGMNGEMDGRESDLTQLVGYRHSRPVREGNAARKQRQLDVYGEICDWAYLYQQIGGELDQELRATVRGCAEFVCAHWSEPDCGIWEARRQPQHYVHGKIMAWVALDRAARLLGDQAEWKRARELIHDSLQEHAYADGARLKQHYGTTDVDAVLLTVPYLDGPVPRGILEDTIRIIEDRLRHGDLVQRYRTDDGIAGQEGGFLVCSFWLVDALLWLGRGDEARALFEELLGRRSPTGLMAEQIDLETGEFRGNFPQAFSHLGLINSAAHLDLFSRGGVQALQGTYADRVKRSLGGSHLNL